MLTQVVQPALVEIGEAWHKGEITIAAEHYASQYCMQHLMGMLAAAAHPTRPETIVAACAPGETHQIGLLMMVVMLRWRGWNVIYLGADLNLDDLGKALAPVHPRILLFTATLVETARRLEKLSSGLNDFPEPKPHVIVGGRAFENFRLPDNIPVTYLNQSASANVAEIERMMIQHTLNTRK